MLVQQSQAQLALKEELERSNAALQELDARATELARQNNLLEKEIRDERVRRETVELRLKQLRDQLPAAEGNRDAEIQQLRHQLSTALEELSVMSEELSRVRELLDQPAKYADKA